MDRFTFILQLLLTSKGQAGTSNLINSPQMNPQSESHSLLQVSLATRDGAEFLTSTVHIRAESCNSIPDLLFLSMWYFKAALMVPAPRTHQTSEELGQQLDIKEERTHLLKTLWHSCLPRLAWVPTLKFKWWYISLGVFIGFLHL